MPHALVFGKIVCGPFETHPHKEAMEDVREEGVKLVAFGEARSPEWAVVVQASWRETHWKSYSKVDPSTLTVGAEWEARIAAFLQRWKILDEPSTPSGYLLLTWTSR